MSSFIWYVYTVKLILYQMTSILREQGNWTCDWLVFPVILLLCAQSPCSNNDNGNSDFNMNSLAANKNSKELWPVYVWVCCYWTFLTLVFCKRQHLFQYVAISQDCYDWPVQLVWMLTITTREPLVTVSTMAGFCLRTCLAYFYKSKACLS